MEVEFHGGWVVVVVCKPIFVSIPTQLSYVEVVLRLRLGCDNCILLLLVLLGKVIYKILDLYDMSFW